MNQPLAVHVSNRQFNVLRECLECKGIALNRMIHISQTTVGGLFRRGYLAFNKKSGLFQLTREGAEVMQQYATTNVDRMNSSRPLSKFVPGRESFSRLAKADRKVA